uniref:Soluble scavenger receptor cysteine-rich domain-containing protein SSC5D n=1 Tax=Latimeria chalumnae TaxID=7897 RepID=H2ZWZ3_LATCH
GRVEVYHNGEWGTVCDDGWGLEEAEVVCREIGCGSAVSAPGSAAFGKGTGMIWLDDVVCTPAAPSIFNCMAKTLGNANCGHIEDAGVVCSGKFYLHYKVMSSIIIKSKECHSFSFKVYIFMGERWNHFNQCSGRVEVYHSGEWGTVCDDDWGMKDAEVVCRQIGCRSAVSAPGSARFGQGTGRIWLDDVACTPAAASIFNCMGTPWGAHNCDHGEDAGVVCSGRPGEWRIWCPFIKRKLRSQTYSVKEDKVRLMNGSATLLYHLCAGRVEVYHNDKWGTVCDDDWGLEEAEVVCREIGCGSAVSAPGSASYGQGTGTIWLDDVVSTATEASIFNCTAKPWGNSNCNHEEEVFFWCILPCTHEYLRSIILVNGPNQCSGRVEVYHSGEWGTVCDDDWGIEDAQVVCTQIGCGSAVSAPGSARFGQGMGRIWLDDVACTPATASIFNCMVKSWGDHDCGHGEDAGVVCSG